MVVATEEAPVYYASTVVGTPEVHASTVAEVGSNRGYRCGKCGQPKKGHWCTADVLDSDEPRALLSSASSVESGPQQATARDSKRRRLDAGPPSAVAGAGTVAVEAVVVEAVVVEAVAVEAVAVEAVEVEAVEVEAVAVEASAWDPQQETAQQEAAALHVAAEASAAFLLPTDDAELAAAETSAEQRVRRLRDDLERVEAAMIFAQAELAAIRRQRGARGAADLATALTPIPEPAPATNLGMSYRCTRCGQPKKGHVCTNSAEAGAEAGAETPRAQHGTKPRGTPNHERLAAAKMALPKVHKQPRGRPPTNKAWDTAAGRWVPIDPAGAEVVMAAEAQGCDVLLEVVAEVVAEVEVEAEVEEEAEGEVAEEVAGAALAPPLDRVRSGFPIEEID